MLLKIQKLLDNTTAFIIIISGFILALLILSAVFLYTVTRKNTIIIENQAIQNQIILTNEEILKNNKKLFENSLYLNFTKEQLLMITQKHLYYSLSINGKSISEPTIYSKSSNVIIVLKEQWDKTAEELLPKSIIMDSSMLKADNAEALIKIDSSTKPETAEYNVGSNELLMCYRLSNINQGEIITLELDQELSDKIGLNSNIIEIIYNKSTK